MAITRRGKVRDKGQLTVPGVIRKAMHLDKDDDVEFTLTDSGELIVRVLTTIPADQKWFWTPEWQAGEREASEQIAAGDVTFHENVDEMFSFLNRDK